MKLLILCLAVFAGSCHAGVVDKCSWGPSYWCSSIKAAKDCGAVQHCMTATWKNNKPLKEDAGEVCQFCETVVGEVRTLLTSQKTQDEIRQFLDSACSVIPDQAIAKECQSVVDQYLPEIMSIIAAELDPQMVCSLMGLCSGLEDNSQHPNIIQIPAVKLEPICTDCKKFFGDVKDLITSASTEKQIEQMIDDQLCSELGTLEDECKQLVATFLPEILQVLASEYDPDMICNAFGLCATANLQSARTLFHRLRLQKSPLYQAAGAVSSSEMCVVCETVLTEIQTLARDKNTQEELESLVKSQLCARLGSLKDACDTTIDTYAPIIFQLLADELDPHARCMALGLCASSEKTNSANAIRKFTPAEKPAAVKTKGVKASAQCVLCEFIMKEVDSLLQDNATVTEIRAALEKVCSILPETIRGQCTDFVDTYSAAIIALLAQELNPEQICTALGLCSETRLQAVPYKPLSAGSDEMCGVCETVVQYIDSLLEDNATISTIEAVMEKVCNFLPKNIQQECDNIVETYGPAIIQLIAQYADPEEICQAIKLCKQTVVEMVEIQPSKTHLLGETECTYGPSYWCASRENAQRCNAVAHCEKHVWNN